VQNAAAVVVASRLGVHVTAVPSALDPLRNWTVPVGPAPLLFVATFAVSARSTGLMVWGLQPLQSWSVALVTVTLSTRYRDWV